MSGSVDLAPFIPSKVPKPKLPYDKWAPLYLRAVGKKNILKRAKTLQKYRK